MKKLKNSLIIYSFFVVTAFAQNNNNVATNSYWSEGKAEINVYEVSQNRYQENHPGQLISIFVTEDFLTDKQVKNEYYTNEQTTWILKNIQLKKFVYVPFVLVFITKTLPEFFSRFLNSVSGSIIPS